MIIKCSLIISGIGTVAAVAALVTALFWLEINIHNPLLCIMDSFRGPNCMQATQRSFHLLHQSDVQLHYKVIKILAVAWYEANAHFQRDYYKRQKLLGTTTKSV